MDDLMSPSTRRAWIEIFVVAMVWSSGTVALHPEGVDRNQNETVTTQEMRVVALHPEGVDRNLIKCNTGF